MDTDDLLKLGLLLLGLLLVIPILSMLFFAPFMGGMMGWPMGGEFGGMYMLGFGWLIPLVFLVLVGVGLYWAVTSIGRTTGRGARDPAIQSLREAYAKGEIDDEEFERRLATLEDDTNRR